MQSRRGFLGSVLGIFATTQIPWVAKAVFDEPIEQPKNTIKDYQTYVRLSDDTIIQGPGVKDIVDGYFKLHDINATRAISYKGSIIYYKGIKLFDAEFNGGSQCLINGDTLRITHSIQLNYYDRVIKPGDKDWDKYIMKFGG
jgi:hypothetical protein